MVMLSGETAGNYPFRYSKMTQIIEAVEDSPLIQVPQNTPQIKQNVLSPKQFVTTLQLWQMSSKLKQFVP
jgi:pyruvate kinase